jgi:hypothetical protein
MGKLEEDEAKIRQRTQVVTRVTKQSVVELLEHISAADYRVCGAGLVVGSQIDPESIANPHIRAHALEGRLFRSVLEDTLREYGVSSTVFVEREIYRQAAALLSRPEADLKRALAGMGRLLGGPWRAEEKLATLAAWMTLHDL